MNEVVKKVFSQDDDRNTSWALITEIFNVQALLNASIRTGSLDWGNSRISFFDGNDNYRAFGIEIGNGGFNTKINLTNNTSSLLGESLSDEAGRQSGGIIINDGKVTLQQTKSGFGTTIFEFELPKTNSQIIVPALAYGSYIIAMQPKEYTVDTLPIPTGSESRYAVVTDAVSPTYLGLLTGGGNIKCPVFYNDIAWVSH